jgi:hypothetical protein
MALHIFHANPVILLKAGAKLEGCVTPPPPPPPKKNTNHLYWQGESSGLAGQSKILNDRM